MIEWCRSGLNFIKQGIPDSDDSRPRRRSVTSTKSEREGTKGRRLGSDVDGLLNSVDSETRAEILTEIRGLEFYTKMKKCAGDIWLRCDLLELNEGVRVNPSAAFNELASEDRAIMAYVKDAKAELRGNRAEDELAWAWFAEDEYVDLVLF